MIQIIPNWHPIFVHFTFALFSTAIGFYTFAYLLKKLKLYPSLAFEFEIVAKWCIWIVSIIVIGTILTGLYAYYTVNHDAPSHVIMTLHRNWALVTAGAIVLVTFWSLWSSYNRKIITSYFIFALFVLQGLLLSTAWHGAELVFRYGIGVMSLPQSKVRGHHHDPENNVRKGKILPSNENHDIHQH